MGLEDWGSPESEVRPSSSKSWTEFPDGRLGGGVCRSQCGGIELMSRRKRVVD
jgi:hypothetical protein